MPPPAIDLPPPVSTDWVPGVQGDFPIHSAVLEALPKGTTITSACSHGTSSWSRTAKIDALLADSTPKSFFLKLCSGAPSWARPFTEGEFVSARLINEAVPGLTPEPVAWGHYDVSPCDRVCFFVGDFVSMRLGVAPDPRVLAAKLAQLHTAPAVSTAAKFGFPVPTTLGSFVRPTEWCDTWAACFARLLRAVLCHDAAANAPWPALDRVSRHVVAHVVPRLLARLDIVPSLIHGDVWQHNIGHAAASGEMVLFDPGCCYAHNEMEFGTWRASWSPALSRPQYIAEYWKLVPPTRPAGEWDDRNRLYHIHACLNDSAGHPGTPSRQAAFNDMLYLVEKYAPLDIDEKYDAALDVSVTGKREVYTIRPRQ